MYIQCNGTPFVSTIDYIGPHTISTTTTGSNISVNIPVHIIEVVPVNIDKYSPQENQYAQ